MSAELKSRKLLWVIPFLTIVIFAGCGSPSHTPTTETDRPAVEREEPTDVDEPAVQLMRKIEGGLAMDGSAEGYPEPPLNVSGVEVHLAHDGTNFYVHARAEGEGWISVGFNQKGGGMDGANMVLGSVDENGATVVRNDLGRGTSHAELVAPGIIEAIFLQEGNFMHLEFSYPMVFPQGNSFKIDGFDADQVFSLITAINMRSDNLTSPHSSRGKINFQVE